MSQDAVAGRGSPSMSSVVMVERFMPWVRAHVSEDPRCRSPLVTLAKDGAQAGRGVATPLPVEFWSSPPVLVRHFARSVAAPLFQTNVAPGSKTLKSETKFDGAYRVTILPPGLFAMMLSRMTKLFCGKASW